MFDGGEGFLGVIGSIPPTPNTVIWVDAKELDFGIIWQHFHPFSSESLANFRQVCTCAFLSRGTLRVLEDFSPSRRSVLPIVFLVTMLPAALRSFTRSSHVVLGWFLTSPFSWSLKLYEVKFSKEPQTEGDWQLFCVSSICK